MFFDIPEGYSAKYLVRNCLMKIYYLSMYMVYKVSEPVCRQVNMAEDVNGMGP